MLHIPLWKRVTIWGLVALGMLFALPNLFYERVELHNDTVKVVEATGIVMPEQEDALAAWPGWLPSRLVNLGLDLRGGRIFWPRCMSPMSMPIASTGFGPRCATLCALSVRR